MYPGRPGAKSPSSNGPTGKPRETVISDAQAREKLAVYVYEYLVHVGAKSAAQTFLSEIRWEKSISIGEPPGFLHSWWCVFWDLYCAAPERRDQNDHSGEAKAFHDYSAHAHNSQPPAQDQHPAFQQYFTGPSGLPGLPPFGAGHCGVRPRVPLQSPGPPIFPHSHALDQYRLMRPVVPMISESIPPNSSPLPMPPGGSIVSELTPQNQPIGSVNSPGHNHDQPTNPDPDYPPPPDGQSFVIQKIKESMQEEAKRFNEEKHIPMVENDDSKPREFY